MKAVVSASVGLIVGFGAALLTIGAIVLLLTGVAGGILVRERPTTGRVLNYDPSDVVLRAAAVAAVALIAWGLYVAIYVRLRRAQRSRQQKDRERVSRLQGDRADDRQDDEENANADGELEEHLFNAAASPVDGARIAAEGATERRSLGLHQDHQDQHK